jgi:hypothetical protein
MLELYDLMAGMTPPHGDKVHFQSLTKNLAVATKGLLAKIPRRGRRIQAGRGLQIVPHAAPRQIIIRLPS